MDWREEVKIEDIAPSPEKEEPILYAIQITMAGDVGKKEKGVMEMLYSRGPIPVNNAKHTQDFTNIRGKKPTLYRDKNKVIAMAKQIQTKCNEISHHMRNDKSFAIHREFFVKPIIWKGNK